MTGTYKQSYYKRLHQIERTQQQLYSHNTDPLKIVIAMSMGQ